MYLLLHVGNSRFALSCDQVIEVIPHLGGETIDYHGQIVPLVDLCFLVADVPAQEKMDSRCVILHNRKSDRTIGLVAEHATHFFQPREAVFKERGLDQQFPFFGGEWSSGETITCEILVEPLFGLSEEEQ